MRQKQGGENVSTHKATLIILIVLMIIGCEQKMEQKMEHPFPRLSKNFPIIDRIDELLHLSDGIEWYKCKDKFTNEEYLVFTSDYPFIKIMNYKTREKFETITRNEFIRRFGQPIYGVGYKTEEINEAYLMDIQKE